MNKEKLEKALDDLFNNYDAFYIDNKYGNNTHKEQFELLSQLKGEKVQNAIGWIKDCYDCYYKDDYKGDETAFAYLRSLINGQI